MMGRPHGSTHSSMQQQPPLPPTPAFFRSLGGGGPEKGKEADLFRCIWCREAFPTMTSLGTHLKEANHGHPNEKSEHSKKTAASPVTTGTRVMCRRRSVSLTFHGSFWHVSHFKAGRPASRDCFPIKCLSLENET